MSEQKNNFVITLEIIDAFIRARVIRKPPKI